jgi:hypothetical protein
MTRSSLDASAGERNDKRVGHKAMARPDYNT